MSPAQTLSPRELALVIGVSESSVKRWIDAGQIAVARTAGGHRRVPIRDAVQFIRQQRMKVLRPDLLGLTDLVDVPLRLMDNEVSGNLLVRLIMAGKTAQARALLVTTYLNGEGPSYLCDGPIRDALETFGDMWKHDERGIYFEHHATDVFIQALNQIRLLARVDEEAAPLALGGAPADDPYLLPSLMAAAVVAEAGFREQNLGPNTPVASFLHAVDHLGAAFVWLSLTGHARPETTVAFVAELASALTARSVPLVVGGQMASTISLPECPGLHLLDSMFSLAAFADERLAALAAEQKTTA